MSERKNSKKERKSGKISKETPVQFFTNPKKSGIMKP